MGLVYHTRNLDKVEFQPPHCIAVVGVMATEHFIKLFFVMIKYPIISRLLAQRDIPRPCAPPCKLALIDDAGHCVPVTYVVFQVCKAARPFCKLDSNAGSVLLRNSPDRAIMLASAHAMVRPPAAIFANCGVKKRVASGEKSHFCPVNALLRAAAHPSAPPTPRAGRS